MNIIIIIILGLIGAVAGYFAGKSFAQRQASTLLNEAQARTEANARQALEKAIAEGETLKNEKLEEVKEKYRKMKSDLDKQRLDSSKKLDLHKKKLDEAELKLKQQEAVFEQKNAEFIQKNTSFEQKSASFEQKALTLKAKEEEVNRAKELLAQQQKSLTDKQAETEKQIADLNKRSGELQQEREQLDGEYTRMLEKTAGMTADEAKQMLISQMKAQAETEAMAYIKDAMEEAKLRANKDAKKIIIQTIQRTAAEHTIENTVSVFNLESDDIKGQIIGREGRNIRALEAATGVEIIVDDTPEAIVISGYDPIRREIARLSLHKLVADGRIHPARIEEVVAKTRKQLEQQIIEIGERTVIELNIHGMPAELIRAIGRMRYRSSYGQNLLQHSVETAKLCAIMAAELGLGANNVKLAKRAGLLHDIGKVPDEETDLSHALLGMKLAEKHKEHPAVINAIGAHHDEIEMAYIISPIVQACDAISGARPGARREILEAYLKRIHELETLAQSYQGVEKAYAIQAGRELRVIVESEKVPDEQADRLSFELAQKIQAEMQYPGQIKVTVIREKRAVSFAR